MPLDPLAYLQQQKSMDLPSATNDDPLVDAMRNEREQNMQIDLQHGPKPDDVARTVKVARDAGMDPVEVQGIEDDAERATQARKLVQAAQSNPVIDQHLAQNPRTAKLAMGDHKTLSGTGGAWGWLLDHTLYPLADAADKLFLDNRPVTGIPVAVAAGVAGLMGDPSIEARAPTILKKAPKALLASTASLAGGVSSYAAGLARMAQLSGGAGSQVAGPLLAALADPLEEGARATNQLADNLTPKTGDWITDQVLGGVGNVVTTLAALATGLGGKAVGLGERGAALVGALTGGVVQGGQSYDEARRQGVDPVPAFAYATTDLASETAGEYAGELSFLKNTEGGASALTRFLRSQIPEQVGENASSVAQSLSAWAALPQNRNMTLSDWAATLPETIASTTIQTLVASGISQMSISAAEKALNTYGERQRAAHQNRISDQAQRMGEQVGQWYQAMIERQFLAHAEKIANGSKLRTRGPDEFEGFMRDMAEAHGVSSVLIPGAALRQYFQSEHYDPETDPLAKYEHEAQLAEAAGNDVVIPVGEALTHLPGTPAWTALKDDMRLTPGGMTPREAQAFEDTAKETHAALTEANDKTDAEGVKEQAVREALIQKATDKLVNDGGMTAHAARAQAEIVVASMMNRAARNRSPITATSDLGFELRQSDGGETAGSRALTQDGPIPVYRGAGPGTEGEGGNYYSTDHAFARQFTRQGLDSEVISRAISPEDVHVQEPLPRATNEGEMDAAIAAATAAGKKAVRVDEGTGEPHSIFVLDHSALQDVGAAHDRRRDSRDSSGEAAPLAGAPHVDGSTGPIPEVVEVARAYAEDNDLNFGRQAYYVNFDPEDQSDPAVQFGTRIAEAYEAMEHTPDDPDTIKAYRDMIRQTRAQYDALVKAGYSFSFFDSDSDPYEGNPFNSMRDIRANKHMAVYSTAPLADTEQQSSFGTREGAPTNPVLLEETGLTWPDQNGVEHPVLANDLFRAVHDILGHGLEGAGFRASGEENAWQSHSRLYKGPGLAAMTSETRGQNSWVNFGPHGEQNRTARTPATTFADQKMGLMPSWTWADRRVPNAPSDVVFHGTPYEFSAFMSQGKPVWFSEDRSHAQRYANGRRVRKSGEGRVIDARLATNKPLAIPLDANETVDDARAWAKDTFGFDLEAHGWQRSAGTETVHDIVRSPAFADAARAQGYDAIAMEEGGKQTWGALTPGSVRSASDPTRVLYQSAQPWTDEHDLPAWAAGVNGWGQGEMFPGFPQFPHDPEDLIGPDETTAIVDGVERAAQNSKGEPITPTRGGLMNFWRWFGDSRMVDVADRPLVFYHGTKADMLQPGALDQFFFDPERVSNGFYFSDDKTTAEGFSRTDALGFHQEPLPVYLRVHDVAVYDAEGRMWSEVREPDWESIADAERAWVADQMEDFKPTSTMHQNGDEWIVTDRTGEDTAYADEDAANKALEVAVEAEREDAEEAMREDVPHVSELAYQGYLDTHGTSTDDLANEHTGTSDAVLIHEVDEGNGPVTVAIVLGAPNDIKSVENNGEFNPDDPRILHQHAAFYSALEQAVDNVSAARAPAAQWIATLKKTPGIKADELDWTGIVEWLESQSAPVAKEDVLNAVKRGGIVVEDVLYSHDVEIDPAAVDELMNDRDHQFDDYYSSPGYYPVEIEEEDENGAPATQWTLRTDDYSGGFDTYDSEEEAQKHADALNDEHEAEARAEWEDEIRPQIEEDLRNNDEGKPKWQDWSNAPEDDESYFELLLRLPPGKGNNPGKTPRTHWDAGGVVAHVRARTVRTEDGKKILFLEEVQSDWHQQAAKRFNDVKGGVVRQVLNEYIHDHPEITQQRADEINELLHENKQSQIYPEVEKWMLSRGNDFAKELKEVADAYRGYMSTPDPEKADAARTLYEEAKRRADKAFTELVTKEQALHDLLVPILKEAERARAAQSRVLLTARHKALLDQHIADYDNSALSPNERAAFVDEATRDFERAREREIDRDADYWRGRLRYHSIVELQNKSLPNLREAINNLVQMEQGLHGTFITGKLTDALNEAVLANEQHDRDRNEVMLREREWDIAVAGGRGVPDAPFRESWPLLAMKRMIVWAAENGYDRIAWIKEGENNGGKTPDDKVGWFYERNLPNAVGKLIKPFGGKVAPMHVPGMDSADDPETEATREALAERVGELPRYVDSMTRTGFDDRIDRRIESLEANNKADLNAANEHLTTPAYPVDGVNSYPADMSNATMYLNRVSNRSRQIASLKAERESLWRDIEAFQERLSPGLAAANRRIADLNQRIEDARLVSGGINIRVGHYPKEHTHGLWQEGRAKEQKFVETRLAAEAEYRENARRIEVAMAAGEAEYDPVDGRQGAAEAPANADEHKVWLDLADQAKVEAEARQKVLDRTSDFERSYAAGEEYNALVAERGREIEARRKLLERPTNLGFEITPQMKETAATVGFPLFQGGERGRIQLPGKGGEGAIIELFKGRNLSTFFHEFGHLRLEQLQADATAEGASDQLKNDWQVVQDWFARHGFDVKDGLIPTGAHEMWARGFERYLMEGRSPSPALTRVFETVRQWLVDIYKAVKNLRAPITPEIREVMDRLLATDDEIDAARGQQNLVARFKDAASAGMSEGEFAAYNEQVEAARTSARGAVVEKVMREIRAREQALDRERRKELTEEITADVADRPLFRALAAVREQRLDRDWIEQQFGKGTVENLPRRVPPMTAENGVHPDDIAEQSGFASGREMISALLAAEAEHRALKEGGDERTMRQRTIQEEVNAAMKAHYGDPMSDGSIEAEATAAVNNDRQGEVLATEIKALARKTGQKPTPYRIARQWARGRVRQGTYAQEASPSAIQRHRRAVAKAGREATAALVAGDNEAALRAMQQQMLSSALLAEAAAANKQVETARRRLDRIASAATMKSVDQEYLDQAHTLLEEVDLRQRTQKGIDRQGQWEEWSAARAAEGYDIVVPSSFEATIGKTNWSRLSVENLLGLDDAVAQIVHLGRLKQGLLDNGERRKWDDIFAEAETGAAKLKGKPPEGFDDPGFWDRLKNGVAGIDAMMLKMETIIDWLDGGNPNGVFNRIAFRPIAQAQHRQTAMLHDYYARTKALFQAVPAEQVRHWRDKLTLPFTGEDGKPVTMPRHKVIAMALNVGNEGNFQRLADGYGWNQDAIQTFLSEHLTAEEWRFVQGVWDTVNTLWPEIAKVERQVNGVAPDKIEPREFDTPHGHMRGGYYPAVYDTTRDYKMEERKGRDTDLLEANYQRATTRASATKARSEQVSRPILLDLGIINRHLGEVIHDITHREAVMQAWRFLTSARVAKAVDGSLGRPIRQQFRPWVKHVANSWAQERAGNEAFGKFMTKLRANVSAVGLGFRATTILVHTSGFAYGSEIIGGRWMAQGLAQMAAHPVATVRHVMEQSGAVKELHDHFDRDIGAQLARLDASRPLTKTAQHIRDSHRFMFAGIGYIVQKVSVPIWIGGYNKAISQGMSDEDAKYAADKAVRQAMGSGAAKDLAAIQRGTGNWGQVAKLFTMFYTQMAAQYQRQRTLGRDVLGRDRRKPRDIPQLAARAFFLLALAPFWDLVIKAALSGLGPDDDESWAEFLFHHWLGNELAPIPIVRDTYQPVWKAALGQKTFAPAVTPIQKVYDNAMATAKDAGKIARGEETKRATRDTLDTIGYTTGLVPDQIAAATQFLVDVSEGDADPKDVHDWMVGLSTGRMPKN